MITKKSFYPLLMIFVFLFSACEKDDDKTLLFPGKSKLDFGYNNNMLELSMGNIADQSLDWSATAQDDFLVLDKTSGTLEAGEYQTLSISLQRDIIAGDSVLSSIKFSSNVGQDIHVGVFIHNYPENKIRLSYGVSDMVFDKSRQLLYILPAADNDFIEVFDISKKTFRRIDLDLTVFSSIGFIQLMPDGKNLIISQYYHFHILDVETEKIVYSHDFNPIIISAVGTPDQRIYISSDSWGQTFHILDLNTLELFPQSISLEGVYLQAHPSWKYLYGIGNHEELMKIDIQGGMPIEVYSNYNYQQVDRLWMSGDGTRIITSDKQFIHIDPNLSGYDVLETEMISVSSYPYILDFAENQQYNEYYLIFRDSYQDHTHLYACDQSMNSLRKITPEPLLVNTNSGGYESVGAMPLQVFSNPSDNSLILLTYGRVDYDEVFAIEILKNSEKY